MVIGHESWVITERVLSQVVTVEVEILRKVHGAKILDKVRTCAIRKVLNIELLFLVIERSQLRYGLTCVQNDPGKIGEASHAGCTHEKAYQWLSKDQVA